MSADGRSVIALPNGARIVFDPMPQLRSAAVGVWLGAGAVDEAERLNGLAHFLEHMAFKGARGLNARQIAEAAESRGADINAATDYERTSYTARCLAADAPDLLDQILALVFAPDHPVDEIGREKNVVLQEIGEAADQPDDLVFDLAQAASFPDHPLGRPILGVEQTLNAIQREDLFAFAAANYSPRRTVVSVAGAFDADEVRKRAETWLAARPTAGERAASAPVVAGSILRSAVRSTEQSHLVIGRPAPNAGDDRRYAARLFAEIFGGGMASRLFQEVREERGLAYSIDASCEQYENAGRVSVYAGCAAGDVGEVARVIGKVWSDLADTGPTVAEVARAKAVMKAGLAMSSEAPAARASRAAHELLSQDRLVPLDEHMDKVDAVSADDIRLIAAEGLAGPAAHAIVGTKAGVRALEKLV
jgi:predicted Zn-dependent peptidase